MLIVVSDLNVENDGTVGQGEFAELQVGGHFPDVDNGLNLAARHEQQSQVFGEAEVRHFGRNSREFVCFWPQEGLFDFTFTSVRYVDACFVLVVGCEEDHDGTCVIGDPVHAVNLNVVPSVVGSASYDMLEFELTSRVCKLFFVDSLVDLGDRLSLCPDFTQ